MYEMGWCIAGRNGSWQYLNRSTKPIATRRELRREAGSIGDSPQTCCMILDDATFEEVVKAQYEPLYRFAFSLVQREADARDLTQEAFAQLGRKAHQVQDKAKLKSWLFTTLYRTFVDSHRWKTRYPHVEADDTVNEMPASVPNAGEGVDAAAAVQALQEVPEVFRVPLTLFYLEQHSYLEIAEIQGIPVGTVMSRISRGRAMLRQLMEDRPRNLISFDKLKSSVAL